MEQSIKELDCAERASVVYLTGMDAFRRSSMEEWQVKTRIANRLL